jgi:ketopantoate reductase
MTIAIIGAGGVGSTLGHAWRRRGHDVTYGVPEPHAAKYASLDGDVTTNQQAAKAADVVVLCTPLQATEQALADCGDSAGKVLIDCTNPLRPDSTSLVVGHSTSGAEQVARWAPGARVCQGAQPDWCADDRCAEAVRDTGDVRMRRRRRGHDHHHRTRRRTRLRRRRRRCSEVSDLSNPSKHKEERR